MAVVGIRPQTWRRVQEEVQHGPHYNQQLLIDNIAELMQDLDVLKSDPTATVEGPATKIPSSKRASDSEEFSDEGGVQPPTQPRRTNAP